MKAAPGQVQVCNRAGSLVDDIEGADNAKTLVIASSAHATPFDRYVH